MMGLDLSKSGLGRHKQKIETVARRLRESRNIAEAIGKTIEDQPDDKMASLNRELLHQQILAVNHAIGIGVEKFLHHNFFGVCQAPDGEGDKAAVGIADGLGCVCESDGSSRLQEPTTRYDHAQKKYE